MRITTRTMLIRIVRVTSPKTISPCIQTACIARTMVRKDAL